MPIIAWTGAAPHSSGCICAGPDRSPARDSNEWLPPFTGNHRCDCLRKVDLGTGGRATGESPKLAKYLGFRKLACSSDGFVEDSAWLQVLGAATSKHLFQLCPLGCGQVCRLGRKSRSRTDITNTGPHG
jgi:hypothetical protein